MNGPFTSEEKVRIFSILNDQSKVLEKLERGMYGDEQNKVKGLVNEVQEIKLWIEKSKRKIAYIAGIATCIGLTFNKIWEWIVNHNVAK